MRNASDTIETTLTPRDVLKLKDVCRKIGVSRTTLFEMIRGGTFPQPIDITPSGSRKGVLVSEFDGWLADRAKARKISA